MTKSEKEAEREGAVMRARKKKAVRTRGNKKTEREAERASLQKLQNRESNFWYKLLLV